MRHCKTDMYINLQQNSVNRSVITVHTNLFAKINRKLHKFATTNSNLKKNRLFQKCVIVKRTCKSIYSKIGLVDKPIPCTQIYLQKIANCIYLQLEYRKIASFGPVTNGHSGQI